MPARAWNSVRVKPGHSTVAVTPVPASSPASPSVNTVTKAFSAEYVPLAMNAGDRRDVEDGAVAACAHRAPGRVAGEHHRPHHDVEPGLLLGEVVVEEGAP